MCVCGRAGAFLLLLRTISMYGRHACSELKKKVMCWRMEKVDFCLKVSCWHNRVNAVVASVIITQK